MGNAISDNAVAVGSGFQLKKGYFNGSSPYLPQSISILGEANTANQSGLVVNAPTQITSAIQAATLYGYGSPIHAVARILFPQSGGGAQVPVYVYPQLAAVGSAAKVITITPTGNATANGTIYLKISGREVVDGGNYAINIVTGDTPTAISTKMQAAMAAVLGCPVVGSGTTTCVCTAKWTGLTSDDINISIDLNGQSLGTTYAVASTTSGSGTPSVAASLALFVNQWNTSVINTYGFVSATLTELEAFNGVPDPTNPTGRYAPLVWKPILAFTGTTLDDPTSLTNASARQNQVTIVPCPAPLSNGMPYEAAANWCLLWTNNAQNTPQSDIINQVLPDMPSAPAGSIPQMNDWNFRDSAVKKGCSTTDYVNGQYIVKDLVTTYVTAGEYPPFYRYPRDLNIYFNYKFGYALLESINLVGKTLVPDSAVVSVTNVIKPKIWKSLVASYNLDCEKKALIVNAKANNKSIVVTINASNPNRMDTTENIQISGVARIVDATVTGGFNFSN